ncbi:VOC family protein [Roseovarius sp.]|uniref:VOC family protein n=1 Tax=Roseovarius sp. TaxID=1486281 RepID=UPI003A976801
MDYDAITPAAFGAGLRGLGLNLLVRDVLAEAAFLTEVFGMTAHRLSADFAIMTYAGQVMQLHADHTYSANPILGLVPETPPRGAGASIHLFDSDPDTAAGRAETAGGMILQPPTNKPHGLRECCILCENGYAWVASRPLTDNERTAS